MKNRKTYIAIFFIILLAFLAGNFSEPRYINHGIDLLNPWINQILKEKLKISLPHFPEKSFRLGLDLQGGTHLLYEADLSNIEKKDYSSSMQGLRDIIEKRVNLFGVQEPVIQIQESSGHYRLIVELAGIKDVSEAIKMIGQTPFLEFKEQRTEEEAKKILDKKKELQGKTIEEIQQIPDWQLALEDPYFKSTQLTGKYLKRAEVVFDQNTSKPLINLQFNDEGAKIFEELTARNVGKPLAIYIDQTIISAPVVQGPISGGKAQISGNFNIASARDLARNLNAGALPLPIKLISQQSVGPTLGQISLEKSLKAGLIGFLAVILFMILLFRIPGIFSSIALIIYTALVLAIFKIIPVTLTLAGIAGFILSIGMAVDGNILIFSRVKEELKQGKTYPIALEEGFRRAWPAIRDGNLTVIIVGVILFVFGFGFVQGFALTLIIGNLISLFSTIFITENFLRCFSSEKPKKWLWLWA